MSRPDVSDPTSSVAIDDRLADVTAAQLRVLVGTLLRSAPLGFCILDGDLRFLFANSALAEMNGARAEDHPGRTIREVVPDVADEAVEAFRSVLETGTPLVGLELEGETPAQPGVVRSWRESVYRVRLGDGSPGVAAIVVETTEQRRSERRTRGVIDALAGFVGLLAPDGTVLEANEQALAASGTDPDEVLGRPMWETPWWNHPDGDPESLRQGVQDAAEGEPVRFNACVRVEGRLVILDLHLTPLVEDGVVAAVVASGVDVTERRSAGRRLRALSDYSRTLAYVETTAAVVDAVLAHLPAAVDAEFVVLALLDPAEDSLTVHHPAEVPTDLAARYRTVPLAARTPLTDAARHRDVVVVESEEENARRYPDLVDDARRAGTVAVAAAPLLLGDECLGALGFGWSRALRDEDAMDARLVVPAELTAQTLRRTRTAEARARFVDELQQHLVPRQSPRPGLETAVRFQVAGRSIGFGGDWYDVVPLDGATALVVGDVAGHGIAAAARMAVLRTALTTVIRTGTPLDQVFDVVEPLVEHLDDTFLGTAAVAVIDPEVPSLAYTSAGHPPLLVRPAGGLARTLERGSRPVLGCGRRGRAVDRVPLGPGSVVVAYTDGLVESRREHLDTALARLRAVLDEHGDTATCEELADLLLATAGSSEDLTDDVVLVVSRLTDETAGQVSSRSGAAGAAAGGAVGVAPAAGPEVTAAYPPDIGCVASARRWASGLCRAWGANEVAQTVELVVDELVTNAIVHTGTAVDLTLRRHDRAIVGSVHDGGGGEIRLRPHDPDRIGGWGLQLVAGLTASWRVTRDDPGDNGVGPGKTVHFEVAIP